MDVTFHLRLVELPDDQGVQVELVRPDAENLAVPFKIDLESRGSQTRRDIKTIELNNCELDQVLNVGSALWDVLLCGPIGDAVHALRGEHDTNPDVVFTFRLEVPPTFENLPWESLYDLGLAGSLATNPNYAIVRAPAGNTPAPRIVDCSGRAVRVLVVIPQGSGLQTTAELAKIREAVQGSVGAASLEVLDGRVTPNRLAEALSEKWDVVHVISHGEVDAQGRVMIRLNSEEGVDGEDWMRADIFARQFLRSETQLVVLNCCNAAAAQTEPINALSGLGAYLMAHARVPAVVAMRYEIFDEVAAAFSRAFYTALLKGNNAGRIDVAVQDGRAALERSHNQGDRARSYITPVLYLADGYSRLFEAGESGPVSESLLGAPVPQDIDERIPERLLRAITKGRCLPIIGPEILRLGRVRHATQADEPLPPDPRMLSRLIAAQCEEEGFPFVDFERLDAACEQNGDWLGPELFARVARHFEVHSLDERFGLVDLVAQATREVLPNQYVQGIARWGVPGFVYTHVDGVLERALQDRRARQLRVMHPEDVRAGASVDGDDLLLLNLRGTVSLAKSLVLSDRDEDDVLDLIRPISEVTEDFMAAAQASCVVFLGVSPADPLVRALGRRLLRGSVAESRGTCWFIDDKGDRTDRAYWERFEKLEWVDIELEALIRGISSAMRQARSAGEGS